MTIFLESSVYTVPGFRPCHSWVLPAITRLSGGLQHGSRVLDVGCGNGSLAAHFAMQGHRVVGIDMAESGICIARASYPGIRFEQLPADRDVLGQLKEEPFDLVYSSEVIEHLYDPRSFLAGCYAATKPGGRFICSTPYHGWLKNVAISVSGKWDRHHDPCFDGGHIKFFSKETLGNLMTEAGFVDLTFLGAGRLPYLWASMVVLGHKI